MSIQHFLMEPEEVYNIGDDTEKVSEELEDKLTEMSKLIESIRNDKDYKSDAGSEAIIAAAEGKYPMLVNGARTTGKYGSFAKFASNKTRGTDAEIARDVSRKIEEIQ